MTCSTGRLVSGLVAMATVFVRFVPHFLPVPYIIETGSTSRWCINPLVLTQVPCDSFSMSWITRYLKGKKRPSQDVTTNPFIMDPGLNCSSLSLVSSPTTGFPLYVLPIRFIVTHEDNQRRNEKDPKTPTYITFFQAESSHSTLSFNIQITCLISSTQINSLFRRALLSFI